MLEVTLLEGFNSFAEKGWRVPGYVECSAIFEELDDPKRQGYLIFDGSRTWKTVLPGPDTLSRFLTLGEGTPREILRFAKKYGPLGVRRRRTRSGHEVIETWEGTSAKRLPDGSFNYFELMESDIGSLSWRARAKRTRQLIEVAQKLHAHEAVNDREWRELEQWIVESRFSPSVTDKRTTKSNLHEIDPLEMSEDELEQLRAMTKEWQSEFDRWRRAKKRYDPPSDPWERLEDAATALLGGNPLNLLMKFHLRGGRLSFSFASSLSDYLAVQTLHAIGYGAGTEMVMCANPECRQMFKPKHRIPEGKRAWCRKCGTRAAAREAMRRMRGKAKSQETDQKEVEV